ncbi:MAG: hypothetical protein IT355_19125 [Gemmatimonadaceae bacterium]|nr:hypothetical protein [Gemmatimonadaceae bacterium]
MPENAGYMFAAYGTAALLCIGYVIALVLRAREMTRRGDAIDPAARQ